MEEELPAGGTVRCALCNTDGFSYTTDRGYRIMRERPFLDEDLRTMEADGDVDEYSAILMRGTARDQSGKLDRVVALLEDLAARDMVTRGRNRAVGLIFIFNHPAVIPNSHEECSSRFITGPGIVGGGLCEFLRMLLDAEDLGVNGSLAIGIDIIPNNGRDHATAHPAMTPAEMENLLNHMRAWSSRESDGNVKPADVHLSRQTDRERKIAHE